MWMRLNLRIQSKTKMIGPLRDGFTFGAPITSNITYFRIEEE